ncbi:hypothetical protein [Actomonas aquatica]|uniref:Type II secretion system protein GspE N-terminal domain-containing protein n=1 Tax=Actomonas aquatica TaxID=2866162 RepID=A0ABZ1CBR8_9BACT|nr:hypothetical protein [Opitutus sp. WL0086]WRQ89095.1 hypothetical protein K1X11_006720 [Opitutus sp. WL0086]
MKTTHRSLLMRANRLLGAQLVEQNLIKIDDLETANEKLLEIINTGTARQRTVLGILAYDLKAVKEEDILAHMREHEGVGLVDLRHYEANDDLKLTIEREACWVTWSVPFDIEEDMTFIATAYYLSPAVRKYWEDQYDGRVLWFGTTLEAIADFIEAMEAEDAKAPKPAVAPAPKPVNLSNPPIADAAAGDSNPPSSPGSPANP